MASATVLELFGWIHAGRQLILPNARAARELRIAFDEDQRLQASVTWEPPKIFSWAQWTGSLWSELVVKGAEPRLLLNEVQEHSLWCEVLNDDKENGSLSSVDSLAELAMDAWRLTARYKAAEKLRRFVTTHDCRAFVRWAEDFVQRCTTSDYLSSALLEQALLVHAQTGSLKLPDSLNLVGFHNRLPIQNALLDDFRQRGCIVVETSLQQVSEHPGSAKQSVSASEHAELELAAGWIRKFLKSWPDQGRRPCVALLVPSLPAERAALDGVLREGLAPELQWIGDDLSSTPWEISGGVPLASVAMISDALAVARWTECPLPVATVSSLLLSPYVGKNGTGSEAHDASARFDAGRLRRLLMLQPEIDLEALVRIADSASPRQSLDTPEDHDALQWVRNVHRSSKEMQMRKRSRSFADWMEVVRRTMRAANWPGTRPLNATEFETTQAWESLLDTVSTLDFKGQRVTFTQALQALERRAQTITFAPISTGAPVQVISVAEAEGCVFDGAIFLRCTDANWPIAESANPLLPWSFQRSFNMPGTDPMRSMDRSRGYIQALMRQVNSILFTCAAEDTNGNLRASPLLDEMNITNVDTPGHAAPPPAAETLAMDQWSDDDVIPPLPFGPVRGGSAVLKLQAACGFLAFAQIRLGATELAISNFGLDALESGNLLHRTMQVFWKTVETQEALRRLTLAERTNLLNASIDSAVSGKLHPRDDWDRAYLDLQKERLCSVLQRWLEEELERTPFRVLHIEQKQSLTVGPLTIELRMDRIDQVSDGVVFVDYKTGYAADTKHWDGPRPDDPQLPLYALLPEAGELKGLAFAKIRAGRAMQWLGYQAENGILPKGKVRDLPALIEDWRATLTRLAEDFATGRASIDPKNRAINCTHCVQRLLCRVDMNVLQADEHHESSDPEEAEPAHG